MLELGERDGEWVEVLGGIEPGTPYVAEQSYPDQGRHRKVRRQPRPLRAPSPCSNASSASPSASLAGAGRSRWRSPRSASGTTRACRSTPCRTSPMSRCRSTPRRRATRRSRSSSASPSRSRPRMAGLPGCDYTRSISRYGLSQVTVVFEDGTDIYFARQLVDERLQQAKRRSCRPASSRDWARSPPASARSSCTRSRPQPGAAAGRQPWTPTDLRTLQDWVIRPQLRNVPGVTEVNTIGGYEQQYPRHARIPTRAARLRPDACATCWRRSRRNNANVGAGYIERNGEQYLIRVPGQVGDARGASRHRRRHARRRADPGRATWRRSWSGSELRTGAATAERPRSRARHRLHAGRREQPHRLAARPPTRLEEVNATLPEGVVATPVYDRTDLVDATIATVQKNLLEGALLVIVVLFLLLGNVRAALDHRRGHPAVDADDHHRHGAEPGSAAT